jgi:hypothetical protein
MGGDGYRCMGNLISRTFVDVRHKQVVAVAEMSSSRIPGADPLSVAPLHIYKTAHITYTVELISIMDQETSVKSESSTKLTWSFTLPPVRSRRPRSALFSNASVKME